MAHQLKVATCCYCGRRTTLQPTARSGHELACGSCGAPLHELKAIKVASDAASRPQTEPKGTSQPAKRRKKTQKVKKRKPLWRKALGEVFEVVEDIFD